LNAHDKRLHAYRDDLADERLRGKVTAARYVPGAPARIGVPVADVLAAPRADAGMNTQFLLGDAVRVFERADGFAWVQGERDGYVGYVEEAALEATGGRFTHVVGAPRTFVYPAPDMKLSRAGCLSMGCALAVVAKSETRGTTYAVLASGEAVAAQHLVGTGDHAADYVSVAEALVGTPYLWGGTSGFGIDCSGLVQLSMRMAARDVPRDTDMQAASVGAALEIGPDLSGLRRGDLVFWKGHVAIMADEATIVHASGHQMMVASEPLAEAVDRIGYLYGGPTAYRRP
jgi:cell wall-associated NlpC family hydrolase